MTYLLLRIIFIYRCEHSLNNCHSAASAIETTASELFKNSNENFVILRIPLLRTDV